jgi:hypothetical protein
LRIRSIRPEDEALLSDLVARTTPEGLPLRFFAATNTTMQQFCRDLGFTITSNADDPQTVRATLALRPAASG